MAAGSDERISTHADVLEIERTFEAPPELVFRLWSDTAHIVRWHGPKGVWLTHCEQDFREGGTWRRCMSNGPGHEHWISGVFREIRPFERLSFTYVNAYDGVETLVEMDFEDLGGRTRMHFRQSGFESVGERDGHGGGWSSSFGLLAVYLIAVRENGGRLVGRPRGDGVAADIAAARERQETEPRAAGAGRGDGTAAIR